MTRRLPGFGAQVSIGMAFGLPLEGAGRVPTIVAKRAGIRSAGPDVRADRAERPSLESVSA